MRALLRLVGMLAVAIGSLAGGSTASGCAGVTRQDTGSTTKPMSRGGNAGVSPSPVVLGEEFTLRNGETTIVGDGRLFLRFEGVSVDGRCSIGSICRDEGDATVVLVAQERGGGAVSLELHTQPGFNAEVTYGTYRVKLVRLEPRPVGEQAVPLPRYAVTLVVSSS